MFYTLQLEAENLLISLYNLSRRHMSTLPPLGKPHYKTTVVSQSNWTINVKLCAIKPPHRACKVHFYVATTGLVPLVCWGAHIRSSTAIYSKVSIINMMSGGKVSAVVDFFPLPLFLLPYLISLQLCPFSGILSDTFDFSYLFTVSFCAGNF